MRRRYHEGAAAVDAKFVAQQFIWSHPRLSWCDVVDDENLEPYSALTSEVF